MLPLLPIAIVSVPPWAFFAYCSLPNPLSSGTGLQLASAEMLTSEHFTEMPAPTLAPANGPLDDLALGDVELRLQLVQRGRAGVERGAVGPDRRVGDRRVDLVDEHAGSRNFGAAVPRRDPAADDAPAGEALACRSA